MVKRRTYRFSLSEDTHHDIVEFLDSIPRPLRGAHIAEGLKLHLTRLKGNDDGEKKRRVSFASLMPNTKTQGGGE